MKIKVIDISLMSDIDKSALLSVASGIAHIDFYEHDFMSVAWEIAEWAWLNFPDDQAYKLRNWWKWNIRPRGDFNPQRAWLDKILFYTCQYYIWPDSVEITELTEK